MRAAVSSSLEEREVAKSPNRKSGNCAHDLAIGDQTIFPTLLCVVTLSRPYGPASLNGVAEGAACYAFHLTLP